MATIATPPGTTDPDPANNTATDSDPVTPVADLAIVKSNGSSTVTSGSATTYTITVTNNGPSSVTGAILVDAATSGLAKTLVTCSAAPGQCATPPSVAQLEGGAFALPALASGATYQIAVTANVTASAGTVANTATVATPPGTVDPNPGNNSATDTDSVTAVASLAVTKTDNSATYTPGGTGTYVVVVTNGGPSAASAVSVTDVLPSGVALAGTVTCASAGTATCGSVSGIAGQTSVRRHGCHDRRGRRQFADVHGAGGVRVVAGRRSA